MGVKISELQEKTSTNDTDVLPIVDATGGTKKITVPNLLKTLTESISNIREKITDLTTYSTKEVKTGEKWIDGKPIYKKVFIFNNRELSINNPINHGISNLSVVVSLQGIFKDSNTFITFPYLYDTVNAMYLKATSTQIITAVPKGGSLSLSASSNRTFYCTIEYTKTTD